MTKEYGTTLIFPDLPENKKRKEANEKFNIALNELEQAATKALDFKPSLVKLFLIMLRDNIVERSKSDNDELVEQLESIKGENRSYDGKMKMKIGADHTPQDYLVNTMKLIRFYTRSEDLPLFIELVKATTEQMHTIKNEKK